MRNLKVLAIIPARGGSKRFPGKNLYPLLNKPLVAYPIQAALKSKLIDRVVISTDDPKIFSVAKRYGGEVPFIRPKNLSGNKSPVIDAVIYTVKRLESLDGYKPDYVVLLQASTPIIGSKQIDRAIRLAIRKKADSVISVAPLDTTSHPYNIREIQKNGTIKFWKEKPHYQFLTKSRPKFYKAANMWLTSYKTLINRKRLEGKNNLPIIVDSIYALDIDYKEDLKLIEHYLKNKKS